MDTKQVNVAVPLALYSKIEKYIKEYGYRNAQDLFLELARKRVIFDDIDERPLRKEFVDDLISMKQSDFIGVKESEELYRKLKKKSNS